MMSYCLDKLIYLLCFLILHLITSCNPLLYSPASPNPVLPDNKGEMQVGIGITGNSNVGVNFYGSYAISEKHFVSVNYLFWRGDVEVDTTGKSCCSIFGDRDSWGSRGTVFEARFGRYWKHLDDPRWRAEIGLNLGYGSISNLRENSDFANVEYINFGIQPAVGFKSRVMWIMGTVKAAYLSYHHFESNFINSEEQAALANFRRKNQNTIHFLSRVSLLVYPSPTL